MLALQLLLLPSLVFAHLEQSRHGSETGAAPAARPQKKDEFFFFCSAASFFKEERKEKATDLKL